MNTDAAVPGLNRNNVYRLEIVHPSIDILFSFDSIIARFREIIAVNNQNNKSLQLTRDTLLPKLLSGEIDLSEMSLELGELSEL
jgi:type I restriction enzyme S subunit